MMRCVVSSVIRRRNSACVSGRRFARPRICAIGRLSASCSSICSAVISMGIRVSVRAGSCESTSCRTRRTMQAARRVRSVSRFRAPPISVCSIHGRGVPRGQAPFRLQREVVDPLDNRRELVEPVLHRRAGQHETVRRIQALHRQRGLGRPVLDPLGLVEHDDVRRPLANDVDVANELLVVAQKESAPARLERGAALGGRALDDGGGSVGEELPLTKPLRLERGGDDDETTADTAGVPEGVAGGNRLRGLAETHVVGQEQAPAREEPFNAVVLIGIERLLEGVQRAVQALPGARGLHLAREPRALFAAAARAVPARRCRRGARRAIDPRAPAAAATLREPRRSSRVPFAGRSQRRRPRSGVPSTQRTRASQSPGPVSGRTGSQRNGAGSGADSRSTSHATPLRDHVLEDGDEVLAQARASSGGNRRTRNCRRAARSDGAACGTGVRATRGAGSRTDPAAGPVAVRRSESRPCAWTRSGEAPRRARRAGPASRLPA